MSDHVLKLQVTDFKKIRCLTVDLNGKSAEITGANGAGKTASIEALCRALGGVSSKDVPKPIRDGAEMAVTVVVLPDMIVTRTDRPSGSEVVLRDEFGEPIKGKPQEILNRLVGHMPNPIRFVERMTDRERLGEILAVCNVLPPHGQVVALLGLDHQEPAVTNPVAGESAFDYIDRLVGPRGVFFLRRTDANRYRDKKLAAAQDAKASLPAEDPNEPPSIAELIEEQRILLAAADLRRERDVRADRAVQDEDDAAAALKVALEHMDRSTTAVLRIEKELETARFNMKANQTHVAEAREKVKKMGEVAAAAQAMFAETQNPEARLKEIGAAIQTADQQRSAIDANRRARDAFDGKKAEALAAQADCERLDKLIAGIRGLGAGLLSGEATGVDGLAVTADGDITLHGQPFCQESKARRYVAAMAICMRAPGKLRTIPMDEGERLDAESKRIIFDMARKKDYQVIMTSVAPVCPTCAGTCKVATPGAIVECPDCGGSGRADKLTVKIVE